MVNKADEYFLQTLWEIEHKGQWSREPRTKWSDGTPAHYKSIFQKSFIYDIEAGEFPIQTYRPTAFKGGWYDIEAIYIKQTNILEEMHPSIHSWWKDFTRRQCLVEGKGGQPLWIETDETHPYFLAERYSLGRTYGDTIRRYDLMNRTLNTLETNPNSRRILMDMWQEEQMFNDPKALVPCAYATKWNVRFRGNERLLDVTLKQRSMDYLTVASINPTQYVELVMMVANHLTYKTGILHKAGMFKHDVEDIHIYDRHMQYIPELLERTPLDVQPKIELICEPKDFYLHTVEDFKITCPKITPLSGKLEIAI